MILPDVNLLVYATVTGFAEHERARRWAEETFNGSTPVGLAHVALFGFLRLVTNRRVLVEPMSAEVAVGHVRSWCTRPHTEVLIADATHLERALALLEGLGTAANLTTDVQLAALALEHDATVHSNDGDFGRFEQLRWVNPLAEGNRPQ